VTQRFAWFVLVDGGLFLGNQSARYLGIVEVFDYYLSLW